MNGEVPQTFYYTIRNCMMFNKIHHRAGLEALSLIEKDGIRRKEYYYILVRDARPQTEQHQVARLQDAF